MLEGDAARLEDREPNFLLVANASGPLGFKAAWTTFLPLMAEPLALVWVKSILYGNGHTAQHRRVAAEFIDPSRIVVAHISADRWNVVEDGSEAPDPTILARVKRASEWLQPTPGLTPVTTETSADAATVLFSLVKGRIGSLIQRAVQGYIWHNLPLVDIPALSLFGVGGGLGGGATIALRNSSAPAYASARGGHQFHDRPGIFLPDLLRRSSTTTSVGYWVSS